MPNTLSPEKLELVERAHLTVGSHNYFKAGVCAMELVSYIADEPFSDHPECVCPTLGAFIRAWNDGLPDDERDALLKPLLPRLIGTRGSEKLAERRTLMATDWLVRVHTPAWLRLAQLDAHANALAALPEITALAQVPSISGPIEAAQHDAGDVAAHAAADAAAWDAAGWAAAAAGDAAGDAVRAAADAAAYAAAAYVAADAAGDALTSTRQALQRSALDLVNRKIDATEV